MSAKEFDDMFLTSKLHELAHQLSAGIVSGRVPSGAGVITPFIRPLFAEKMVGIGWTTLVSVDTNIQCLRCSTPITWQGVVWANPVELQVSLEDARAFSSNLHRIIEGNDDRAWCGTWPIFVDRIREDDKWVYTFQRMSLPIHGGAVTSMVKTLDEFLEYIDTNGWTLQEDEPEEDLENEFLVGL